MSKLKKQVEVRDDKTGAKLGHIWVPANARPPRGITYHTIKRQTV